MQVRYGSTRVVFLFSIYAVKFWRPRPLRPFVRFFQLLQEKEVSSTLRSYDQRLPIGALKYLLAGVIANRAEYRSFKRFPDAGLAPVTSIWLGGFAIVQLRGEPVTRLTVAVTSHPLWSAIARETNDVTKDALRQFAVFNYRVLVVDYASPIALDRLDTLYGQGAQP